MSLSYWGDQNWTQHSRCLDVSPEGERFHSWPVGSVLPNAIKEKLLFLAERTHCSLKFSLLSTEPPSPSLQNCFLLGLLPAWACFSPRCRNCYFPFFSFVSFLLSHLSSLLKFIWMAAEISSLLNTSPLCNVQTCTLFYHIYIINEIIKQYETLWIHVWFQAYGWTCWYWLKSF